VIPERWQDLYRAVRDADPDVFRKCVLRAEGYRLWLGLTLEQGAKLEEAFIKEAFFSLGPLR
jgi:hypothetical protein